MCAENDLAFSFSKWFKLSTQFVHKNEDESDIWSLHFDRIEFGSCCNWDERISSVLIFRGNVPEDIW